ncbi:MAG: hypothetical protein ACJ763_16630 [Bdellovibrionia bacterium]
MKTSQVIFSGTAGALALNGIHEAARNLIPNAPHVDILGMRAMGKTLQKIRKEPSKVSSLRKLTFVADVISNSLYYGVTIAALGKRRRGDLWKRAWISGGVAGIIVATLPPLFGLGYQGTRKPAITAVLTATWYLSGALVTAAIASALSGKSAAQD